MASNLPFDRNVNKYSRQLWNKDTYLFLADFFGRAAMDSNVKVEDGKPLSEYCRDDGKNWVLPGAGGAGGGQWSGRVLALDGTILMDVDVSVPENITGEWIRYDGVSGSASFASYPNVKLLNWKVADAPVAPLTQYTLSDEISGDIVVPVPKDWKELQMLISDAEGTLKFKDLNIKTTDPEVGMEFKKPDDQDDDEPKLLQLKTKDGNENDIYVCGKDGGASWKKLGIRLEQVGTNGLKVVLEIGDDLEIESEPLYGGECNV